MNSRTSIRNLSARAVLVAAILGLVLLLTAPAMGQVQNQHQDQGDGLAPIHVQSALPERIMDRVLALAYTYDLARQDVQTLLDPMERAASRDLPVEPLLRKVEEGLAKRVSPGRIATALETQVTRFEDFADILDSLAPHVPRNREHVLQRMDGLAALGIGPDVITDYLDQPAAPSLGQVLNALETKAGLTQNGISVEDAERIVNSGLAVGYFQEPGWDLARLARAAGKAGISQDRISRSIQDAVKGHKDSSAVAKELGVTLDAAPGRSRHGGGGDHDGGRRGGRQGSATGGPGGTGTGSGGGPGGGGNGGNGGGGGGGGGGK